MPAHHLKYEGSLMGSGRGIYAIDSFADPVQSSRGTNRQVGHGHIVVDGPNEPYDLEVPMLDGLGIRDSPCQNVERGS